MFGGVMNGSILKLVRVELCVCYVGVLYVICLHPVTFSSYQQKKLQCEWMIAIFIDMVLK